MATDSKGKEIKPGDKVIVWTGRGLKEVTYYGPGFDEALEGEGEKFVVGYPVKSEHVWTTYKGRVVKV